MDKHQLILSGVKKIKFLINDNSLTPTTSASTMPSTSSVFAAAAPASSSLQREDLLSSSRFESTLSFYSLKAFSNIVRSAKFFETIFF
jgi:hypothetical protein